MKEKLARALYDADFGNYHNFNNDEECSNCGCQLNSAAHDEGWCDGISIETLIDKCGEEFGMLQNYISKDTDGHRYWRATQLGKLHGHLGDTPTEAIAKLWLDINGHPTP